MNAKQRAKLLDDARRLAATLVPRDLQPCLFRDVTEEEGSAVLGATVRNRWTGQTFEVRAVVQAGDNPARELELAVRQLILTARQKVAADAPTYARQAPRRV